MGFDLDPETYVEFELLEKFRGRITDIMYVRSEKASEWGSEGYQVVVKITPEDVEANDQIGFYSMGARKSYDLSEDTEIQIGQMGTTLYGGYVAEGPPLNKSCRAAQLFTAMETCGFPVAGADLRQFKGSVWDWERVEPPERGGIAALKEKPILVPTALIKKAEAKPSAPSAIDIEEILLATSEGKKAVGELVPALYPLVKGNKEMVSEITSGRWLAKMKEQGKLTEDKDGVLHSV